MTAYIGIDYGLGRTNIDHSNGIRYGVISQHSLGAGFFDCWEAEYGDPTCRKCGNTAIASDSDQIPEDADWNQGRDYACLNCQRTFWSDEAFGDEPIGHSLDTDGIKAIDCLDTDVMIIASPFYTFAPFCSPCVPGAGNLDSATSGTEGNFGGVKAYCFGHDWFDDGKAPYKVYRVADDSEVLPEAK